MIRVAVVDDQHLVREGFSLILGAQPDIEIALQAEHGQQLLDGVAADPVSTSHSSTSGCPCWTAWPPPAPLKHCPTPPP